MDNNQVIDARLSLIKAALGLADAVERGDEVDAAIDYLCRSVNHLNRCKTRQRQAYATGLNRLYDGEDSNE